MEENNNIDSFFDLLKNLPENIKNKLASTIISGGIALSNVEKNTLNDSNKTEISQAMGLEQGNFLADLLAGRKTKASQEYVKKYYEILNRSVLLEQKYRDIESKKDGLYDRMANAFLEEGNVNQYQKYNFRQNASHEENKELLNEQFNRQLSNNPNYKFLFNVQPKLESYSPDYSNPSLISHNYNLIINNNADIQYLKFIYALINSIYVYENKSNKNDVLIEIKLISDNGFNTFVKNIMTVTSLDILIKSIVNEGDKEYSFNMYSQENIQSERKIILKGDIIF